MELIKNKRKTKKIFTTKTFVLSLNDEKTFENLFFSFFDKNSGNTIKKNDNKLIVSIKKNNKDFFYILISKYLLSSAIDNCLKEYAKYKDSLKDILSDDYFLYTTIIETKHFFKFNNYLIEDTFLNFNMFYLKKEVSQIYEIIKTKETIKKQIDDTRNVLIKKGINLKDYETLRAKFNENGLYLVNDKNEKITFQNMKKKFLLNFNDNGYDNWERDLLFCDLMCFFLKTKKLYISKKYIELYEDLIEMDSFKEHNVEIILED